MPLPTPQQSLYISEGWKHPWYYQHRSSRSTYLRGGSTPATTNTAAVALHIWGVVSTPDTTNTAAVALHTWGVEAPLPLPTPQQMLYIPEGWKHPCHYQHRSSRSTYLRGGSTPATTNTAADALHTWGWKHPCLYQHRSRSSTYLRGGSTPATTNTAADALHTWGVEAPLPLPTPQQLLYIPEDWKQSRALAVLIKGSKRFTDI